ncbi:MAG: DUF4105 domain-containing protein [Bacteroidetes bacterium]|nr:MAG: DUF4105 domain-containing protein [Bacteroidota bacterium]
MVKKLTLSILFFFLLSNTGFNQSTTLSSSAQINILTCGPGSSMTSRFGHTGLEVIDPELDLHEVYNFGTFNFNIPFFYVKYLRGSLKYYLGIKSYEGFLERYQEREDRTIYRQVLDLDSLQVQTIYDLLQEASLPENKYYIYDFIRWNCTTKTKDLMDRAIGSVVRYDTSFVDRNKTYRNYLNTHLSRGALTTVGVNLIFGNKTDKVPSFEQYSFLPDNYKAALDHAFIGEKPLVKRTETLHVRTAAGESFLKRSFIVWGIVLFFFFLTLWEYRRKMDFRKLDILLFSIAGLLSLVLIFMWLFSSHDPATDNPDLLWLTPLHFIFVFNLKKPRFSFYYALILGLVMVIMLGYYLFVDFQDMGVFALLLILLIRLARRGVTGFETFKP